LRGTDEGTNADTGNKIDSAHVDNQGFARFVPGNFHRRGMQGIGAGLIETAGQDKDGDAVLAAADDFHQEALAAATAASRVSWTA
jgi:hypothetical protein